MPQNSYTYTIPYGDQTVIKENLNIKEELQAVLHLEQDVGRNNTLSCLVRDASAAENTFFHLLLYLLLL